MDVVIGLVYRQAAPSPDHTGQNIALGIFLAGPVLAWAVWRFRLWRERRRWRHRGYCQSCGYWLRGNVSGVCPECGTAVK